MHIIRAVLALSLSLPFAGLANAASLTPQQAVAYLLVGVQVGQTTELSGMQFTWQEATPGHYSGAGSADGHAMELAIDVTGTSPCVYTFDTRVTVDTTAVYTAQAIYDFNKISGMTLTGPTTAQIAGTGYCTSDTDGVCTPEVSLSVPTDEPTFSGVYRDLSASCN